MQATALRSTPLGIEHDNQVGGTKCVSQTVAGGLLIYEHNMVRRRARKNSGA